MNYSYFKLSHMAMILALCGILPVCSQAAPPAAPHHGSTEQPNRYLSASERDYITTRDRAIAEFKPLETRQGTTQAMQDAVTVREKKALADLQRRLSAIIGPLAAVPGIPSANTISLTGLCQCGDTDDGVLDGLRSPQSDSPDSVSVLISTRGLTEHWLHSDGDLSLDIASALKNSGFYGSAFSDDYGYIKIMALTLKKPEGVDIISAQLSNGTNGDVLSGDEEILVGIVKGNRVLIAKVRARPAVPKIANCAARFHVGKETDAANTEYQACMGRKLSRTSAFPALLAQAQKLANNLARL